MDMTLKEIKLLTNTCCNQKYQLLTTDLTTDKYNGRYRLALNSLFFPITNSF